MHRNIVTTITFSYGRVEMSVLEKLPNNTVEIFYNSTDINRASTFIPSSISHVEKLIGGRVKDATFVIEPSNKVGASIELSKETIKVVGDSITKQDVTNLLEIVKANNESESRRTILVQPLKFEVSDVMTKSYTQAPINKVGDKLSVVSAITTISKETYDYLYTVAKNADLKISEILLSNQTKSHSMLSRNVIHTGASHIHIGNNQAEVTISKNNAVVATLSMYEFGFKHLLRGIANEFNCTIEEAKELVDAHANIENNITRVIYSNQIGTENISYTNIDLAKIIKVYLNKLLVNAKQFLVQRGVTQLPLVFTGRLGKLDGMPQFIKEITGMEHISVYQPLSFIEMEGKNHNGLGVINFKEVMNNIMGVSYDTIVQTNPNTLKIKQERKSFIGKLMNKIGGKYDWN